MNLFIFLFFLSLKLSQCTSDIGKETYTILHTGFYVSNRGIHGFHCQRASSTISFQPLYELYLSYLNLANVTTEISSYPLTSSICGFDLMIRFPYVISQQTQTLMNEKLLFTERTYTDFYHQRNMIIISLLHFEHRLDTATIDKPMDSSAIIQTGATEFLHINERFDHLIDFLNDETLMDHQRTDSYEHNLSYKVSSFLWIYALFGFVFLISFIFNYHKKQIYEQARNQYANAEKKAQIRRVSESITKGKSPIIEMRTMNENHIEIA